jgi:hypothetical protein
MIASFGLFFAFNDRSIRRASSSIGTSLAAIKTSFPPDRFVV